MQTGLNQSQRHILTMFSFAKSTQALDDLKAVLAQYYAQKVEADMEHLWNQGILNAEKLEQFNDLHERTPYTK